MPKKPPLISKDHERAYFDSADWALGKQGVAKPKGPLEALRPKLQPTHQQQQQRSRRSIYTSSENEDADGAGAEDMNINWSGSPENVGRAIFEAGSYASAICVNWLIRETSVLSRKLLCFPGQRVVHLSIITTHEWILSSVCTGLISTAIDMRRPIRLFSPAFLSHFPSHLPFQTYLCKQYNCSAYTVFCTLIFTIQWAQPYPKSSTPMGVDFFLLHGRVIKEGVVLLENSTRSVFLFDVINFLKNFNYLCFFSNQDKRFRTATAH